MPQAIVLRRGRIRGLGPLPCRSIAEAPNGRLVAIAAPQ